MTSPTHKELREAAERAEPKEFEPGEAPYQNRIRFGLFVNEVPHVEVFDTSEKGKALTQFFALANPQTVLSLLDEIERLKGTIECDRGAMKLEIRRADSNFECANSLETQLREARAALVRQEIDYGNLNGQLRAQLERAVGALKFTLHAAEHLFQPDKPLERGLDPTFYFTLTYEGDLELIERTRAARAVLAELEAGK